MLLHIVSNTPRWVWVLLLVLVCLGVSQRLSRTASRGRVIRIALAMAALSLYGTVSAFGLNFQVLTCWFAAAVAVGYMVLLIPLAGGTHYLAETDAFAVPGSWTPLALIVGLFALKYLVGILVAMHMPVVHAALFGPALGLLYGAFSGAFLGRAGRLILLANKHRTVAGPYLSS